MDCEKHLDSTIPQYEVYYLCLILRKLEEIEIKLEEIKASINA